MLVDFLQQISYGGAFRVRELARHDSLQLQDIVGK
jgi:hypothetical protein